MNATPKRRQGKRDTTPGLKYKSVFLILLAFATALFAQGQMARSYEPTTLWPGLLGLVSAVFLFLAGTWDADPESGSVPISPRFEALGAACVFFFAVFTRFWQLGGVSPGLFLEDWES